MQSSTMLTSSPETSLAKISPFGARIFLFLILTIGVTFVPKAGFSYDFGQIIDAFERDFERIDPIKMRGRFESIVKEITDMDVRKDVDIVYRTRGEVKEEAFAQDLKRRGLSDDIRIKAMEFILKQLHIMDREQSLKDVLSEYGDLNGFYNPTTRQIVIIQGTNKKEAAETLFHELVHVAQDTTCGLDGYMEKHSDTIDSSLAALAVIEGQAVAARFIMGVEQNLMDKSRKEILASYMEQIALVDDPFQQKHLDLLTGLKYFPYTFGLNFFLYQYVKQNRGFADMLEKVPVSTEQVIHPEKFLQDEKPLMTVIQRKRKPFSPLGKIRPFFNTTLGQYFMMKIVNPGVESDTNAKICEIKGWGGDRIFVFESSRGPFFIWDTIWDSSEDAKSFCDCYIDFCRNRYHSDKLPTFEVFTEAFKDENTNTFLKLEGNRFTIIEGIISQEMIQPLKKVLAH